MMYELVLASLYFSFLLGTKKEKGTTKEKQN